mgnify:CR=1 FL=1
MPGQYNNLYDEIACHIAEVQVQPVGTHIVFADDPAGVFRWDGGIWRDLKDNKVTISVDSMAQFMTFEKGSWAFL